MQIVSSTDTERNLAVELILEDIPGGGVVEKDDFKTTSTGMQEGALLGVASDGIYHLTKTAKAYSTVASGGTTINVFQGHEFKTGDILVDTGKTFVSRVISGIAASGTYFDILTIAASGGVNIAASGIFIEAAASGLTTTATFKYSPVAIATNPVDLSVDNTGCGLLVRGRVRESLLPYPVDATIKALLPLIRFV